MSKIFNMKNIYIKENEENKFLSGCIMRLCAGWQIASSHIATMEAIWLEASRPETILVSKWHFFRTTTSCQKLILFSILSTIPLKGITRSRMRKDKWDVIWQLPWDLLLSSTKASWNSSTLSLGCTVSPNRTEETPQQAIKHPWNKRTKKTEPWAVEQWACIIIFII